MAKRKRQSAKQEAPKNWPAPSEHIDLARKYRPINLDEFYGNAALKRSLKPVLDKGNIPQQTLFYGDKGSGKTTLARMFAQRLGCSEFDLKKIDTADFRGIDTVREVRRTMGTSPMQGKVKVYILDECFAPNTLITMHDSSQKKIINISSGDKIQNLQGVDVVKRISKNRVSLDRLVKLKFDNDSVLFTTKDHVFFTENGEIEAKNINKNDLILSFDSSIELQSGYWKQTQKNCYRNRWKKPQHIETKRKGQKETKQIGRIRLESIAFYESRSDRKYFQCIIGDKERKQGYVEFYDLEIENHPSYFAENIAVHNCHMLGRGGDSSKNEAQNALLTALEEPPKHVYFFLCTTDPQQLIGTIKSRCVQYRVSTLSEKQIYDLVSNIAEKEGVDLPKKVGLQIAKDSLGYPREALKILEKILYLDEEEMLESAKQEAEKREQSIALSRALVQKKSWKEISSILKNLDEEPEQIRRNVRGYGNSMLLNGSTEGFILLDVLSNPYYNIDGKNQLTRDIYEIWGELND